MLLNCAMAANTNVQIKLYLRNIMQSCVVLVALKHVDGSLTYTTIFHRWPLSRSYDCFEIKLNSYAFKTRTECNIICNYYFYFISRCFLLLLACCTSVYYQSVIKDLISFELCVLLHDYNAYFDEIHFF
jgi:hypothetical protein